MSFFYGHDIYEEEFGGLPLSGGIMSGDITMGDNTISEIKSITFSDSVYKVDFNNKQLKNISAPTNAQDAISKGVLDCALLDYEKKYGWRVTHEIDVANCDIEYWAGSLFLVRNIVDRRTGAIGTVVDKAHSMSVDNSLTPTSLICRRTGDDSSIRVTCDYIRSSNYSIFLVARRDTRWTATDGRGDILFSNSDGNWDMHCRLGTGAEQGRIYVSGGIPLGEVHTNIQDDTDFDSVFCLSMHCNVGHGRSHLYLNGTKLSLKWTKDYSLSGVPYLSVGSHPNISSSNYSPDMSVYLVRIIQGEMDDQEITTMHADLLTRFVGVSP